MASNARAEQNLITNSVIAGYTDPRVRIKLPVRISYKRPRGRAAAVRATEAIGARREPRRSRLMHL
jgi:hypothetical protein